MKPVEVGDAAPDFSATDADGETVTLSQFQGKQAVVLYFYPHDNTPVCTTEACAFRDAYQDFVDLGAEVIGVSSDSDDSHRSFANQHKLPFHLIADGDGALRKLFGVPNTLFVLPGRVTYVIDREGIVRLKFNSQLFGNKHIEEALAVVRQIQQS